MFYSVVSIYTEAYTITHTPHRTAIYCEATDAAKQIAVDHKSVQVGAFSAVASYGARSCMFAGFTMHAVNKKKMCQLPADLKAERMRNRLIQMD